MTLPVPAKPKIYHIAHVDRLPSIVADSCLWCDATIAQHNSPGTTIGMNVIKQRRLQLLLKSHSDLHVGDCVPFYFCPRSVMLYLIYQANHAGLLPIQMRVHIILKIIVNRFPWHLIERIGVYSDTAYQQAANALPVDGHRPTIKINRKWYY